MRKQYEPPHWWKHAFATRRLTVWLTRSVQIPVALDGFRTVSGHPPPPTKNDDDDDDDDDEKRRNNHPSSHARTNTRTNQRTNQPSRPVTPRGNRKNALGTETREGARTGAIDRCDRRDLIHAPRVGDIIFTPFILFTHTESRFGDDASLVSLCVHRGWTRATRDFRFRVPLVISGSRPAVVVCVEIKYHRWVPLFDHFRCERTNERPKRTNERTNGADARGSAHRRC